MRIDKDLPKMDQWVCLTHGHYVLDVERKVLDSVLDKYYGYHIVQIGGPTSNNYLQSSLIRHKVRIGVESSIGFPGNNIRSDLNRLPFVPDSIDVMVLPHVLEYVASPYEVLDSCFTSMAPEGRIVILGFNPFSLWGLAKMFGPNDRVFRRAHFIAPYKLRRWLKRAGFDVQEYKSMCFRWPSKNPRRFEKLNFLEPLGRFLTPGFGGVYMMIAQKRLIPMNVIGLDHRNITVQVRSGVAEPT